MFLVQLKKKVSEQRKSTDISLYPEQINHQTRKGTHEEESPKYTVCLLYVSELSEDLRRAYRRFDIKTVVTTISTLTCRRQLNGVENVDPLLGRTVVVYRVPCSCGKELVG